MIKIMNLKTDGKPDKDYDFIVSLLGNPFFLKDESFRDKVCDEYEKWFESNLENEDIKEELDKLLSAYKKTKTIRLWCWCSPKRCHAETIKKWIENNDTNS